MIDSRLSLTDPIYPTWMPCSERQSDASQSCQRVRSECQYVSALLLTTIPVYRNPVEDDVYNGYHIPKGTTLLVNVWYVFSLTTLMNCEITLDFSGECYTTPTSTRIPTPSTLIVGSSPASIRQIRISILWKLLLGSGEGRGSLPECQTLADLSQ